MDKLPMYTLQRVSKTDKDIGKLHASHDAETTLCGQNITEVFVIVNNDHDGKPTCKACLRELGASICKESEHV